ncbi:MAG: class I SAM-dependent methyltransferase, partial [Thermosulfidibacteraceae bacterium]
MNGDRNILKELIAERIKENGPISFREFMEMALYYPKFGYYEKEVSIGKTGDFVTSPKVGSIFGRTLFKAFREMLEIVESNTLLELGAGDGTLAEDIILKAKEINIELDYIIIEKSEKLRRMIRNKLGKYRVKILKSLEEIGDKISGIIFSNELIDALPVHIVEREKDGLYEIFIDCKDGEFEELKVKLKDKRIISYINEMGIELRDGQRIEVNLDAEKILASIYEILEKGFVVFIDYGYIAEEITAPYRLKG